MWRYQSSKPLLSPASKSEMRRTEIQLYDKKYLTKLEYCIIKIQLSERNILDESSTILLKHFCTLNIIISLDYKDIISKKLNVLYILRRICLHIWYFYTFFVLLSGLMLAILLLSPSNIIHSNNNVVETYFIQSLPSD